MVIIMGMGWGPSLFFCFSKGKGGGAGESGHRHCADTLPYVNV